MVLEAPKSIFQIREMGLEGPRRFSLPPEIGGDLAPFGSFPFDDPRRIAVLVKPFLGPFDQVENRLILRNPFQQGGYRNRSAGRCPYFSTGPIHGRSPGTRRYCSFPFSSARHETALAPWRHKPHDTPYRPDSRYRPRRPPGCSAPAGLQASTARLFGSGRPTGVSA